MSLSRKNIKSFFKVAALGITVGMVVAVSPELIPESAREFLAENVRPFVLEDILGGTSCGAKDSMRDVVMDPECILKERLGLVIAEGVRRLEKERVEGKRQSPSGSRQIELGRTI